MVVLFLPVIGLYLWMTSDVELDPEQLQETRALAQEERAAMGRLTRDQAMLIVVFVAVAVGWLTETVHGVHPGIVALAGAIALFLSGRLQSEDLGNISWSALLTFGGGLTLGLALVDSGTSDYLASRLTGLAGLPSVLPILALALATLVLTTVASNTASAAILIPVAIPLAGVIGLDPTLAVVVVAIASSVDFALVIGTPPTMIAYSTRLFRANEIFRKGAVLDLAAIAVLILVVTRIWDMIGAV
jgi:sodium-dependent dicarboxylate transporter 2/3/5